jgi:hypothetical protein
MTADVTYLGDETEGKVLCIPIEALVGPTKRGSTAKCYVITPAGTEAREVSVGLSDETSVEIRSGLEAGEQIVLNPVDKKQMLTGEE